MQDDDDGVEHPLCCFSEKFDVHQRHYSTIEKEELALILALKHFEVYVTGVPLLVYTDHNPLVFINSMRDSNLRIMHWSVFLQGYDFATSMEKKMFLRMPFHSRFQFGHFTK